MQIGVEIKKITANEVLCDLEIPDFLCPVRVTAHVHKGQPATKYDPEFDADCEIEEAWLLFYFKPGCGTDSVEFDIDHDKFPREECEAAILDAVIERVQEDALDRADYEYESWRDEK